MSLSGRLDGQLQTPIGRTLRSKTLGIHGYRRIAPSKAALFETSGNDVATIGITTGRPLGDWGLCGCQKDTLRGAVRSPLTALRSTSVQVVEHGLGGLCSCRSSALGR